MKQIIIQALDEQMVAALDSLGDDYQATFDGKPNPQTKEDYAKEKLLSSLTSYLSNIMSSWITQAARDKARDAAKQGFIITIQ